MISLLWSILLLICFPQNNAEVITATTKAVARRSQNSNTWDYTDVPYGDEDPSVQLLNIALPEEGDPYGVLMFHHSAGGSHFSVTEKEVNAAHVSGYAVVSWESIGGVVGTAEIELAWSYAQICFDFLRTSANVYGWDPDKIIVAGRSLGSIVSWKLAHSQHPAIVGIYTYNGLPQQVWTRPDLWYPPDDVVSPVPLTYMVYGPGPKSDDGHNPTNAYPVVERYNELGEEEKLIFVEGMWNDPGLYSNGEWINEYDIFHYLPELVANIEDGVGSTITPTTAVTPPVIPTHTNEAVVGLPYQPFTQGANGLYIGHSFFIPISRTFDDIVAQAKEESDNLFPQHDFQTEFSGGESGTPGNLWSNVGHRTSIKASLSTGTIDLFGMTIAAADDVNFQEQVDAFLDTGVYPTAEEYIPEYAQWIDMALSYNPDTVIYIGAPWLGNNHLLTTQTFTGSNEFICGFLFNSVVLELRRFYPDNQILFICYGPVASFMRQLFDEGNLPDIVDQIGSGQNALFTDADKGHAGPMMKEMMAIVWLQILYNPPNLLLERFMDHITIWNKDSVRAIVTEVLTFNKSFNVKEGEIMIQPSPEPTIASPNIAHTTTQPSPKPPTAVTSSPSVKSAADTTSPSVKSTAFSAYIIIIVIYSHWNLSF